MKVKHWDVALARWAQSRLGAPFKWGETDCALLAFEAWDLQVGTTLADAYRGRYSTELGARRFMLEQDVDIRRVIEAQEHENVAPGFAQRGDLIMLVNDWPSACVCFGRYVLAVPAGEPVGFYPIGPVVAAGCNIYRVA